MYKFYDTSSLLIVGEHLFEDNYTVVISSISIMELENIKTASNKDADIKYAARNLVKLLDKNPDKYILQIFTEDDLYYLAPGTAINDDARILASSLAFDHEHPDEVIFVTNDLCLKRLANMYYGNDSIMSIDEEVPNDYFGYKEVILDDAKMEYFYTHKDENTFNLLINEYLLVYNDNNELVDTLCWTGTSYRHLSYATFSSKWFGDIKPFQGDPYQQIAADSLLHNQVTMLRGPAGTGKTLLSLGCLMSCLEHGKLDKLVIFCNTVATKGSAKLGYYPGNRNDKLLDSQIGNLLSSKLGDKIEVERMIEEGQLILLPLSDIRGYDTTGMKAGVYISEAQNLDIALLKLALQRIGDDSMCIIDGDYNQQVDDVLYSGMNNGMRRASQVFRGHNIYGEIKLQKIHRSNIAKLAEKM